jgi:HK97 family phage major capsid protein
VKTDRLVFNFPTETAGMGALAAIVEEANYIADEPAFATVPATMVKYGHMITITEEFLDDQTLFEPYFVKAVGRAWALAENLELFTKLKATDTVGKADATFTDPFIMEWFFTMTAEWAQGAHIVCLRATLGVMRALLIGTPRAYGAFPDFGGGAPPTFMGLPLHTDANWEVVMSGAGALQLSLVNPDAVGWVENKGLQIKVDPYGDALAGRIRYFPRARFDCEILQVLGHVSYLDA